MAFFNSRKTASGLLNIALVAGAAAMLIALGLLDYLGAFTRYLADDFCEAVLATQGSLLGNLLHRYLTVSDRYSNLLFVALTEFLSPRRIEIVPVVVLVLWVVAWVWLAYEIQRSIRLGLPFAAILFSGGLLAFFPVFEAPNLFQTIYWRSGLSTHFVPLVCLTALCAFLLFQIRRLGGRRPAIWLGLLFFIIAFFVGGFSEPPVAVLIVAALFALLAVYFWGKGELRPSAMKLIAWTLAGGILALLVMKFSPGNSFRLAKPPPGLITLGVRTVIYSAQFILDSLATLPTATIASAGMSFLLFYALFAGRPAFSSGQKRVIYILILVAPILMYILIAASFSPSVYGQSYPVERARFAGRVMMTTATLVEGACFGVLFAQWKFARSQAAFAGLAAILLMLSALYPLRGAWGVLQINLPEYRLRTTEWDARQTQILSEKAQGQQDLVVRHLPGFEYLKEFDVRAKNRVNCCAAAFYGVQSIRSVR